MLVCIKGFFCSYLIASINKWTLIVRYNNTESGYGEDISRALHQQRRAETQSEYFWINGQLDRLTFMLSV